MCYVHNQWYGISCATLYIRLMLNALNVEACVRYSNTVFSMVNRMANSKYPAFVYQPRCFSLSTAVKMSITLRKKRKLADISLYAGYWNELNAVMDSTKKKIVSTLAGRQIGFRPSQLLISPLHFEPEFLWPDSICYKLATKTVRSNKLCNWKLLNLVNSVFKTQWFLYVPFVCTLYLCILLLWVP